MTGLLGQSLLNLYTSQTTSLDLGGQPRPAGTRTTEKTGGRSEPAQGDAAAISPQARREAEQGVLPGKIQEPEPVNQKSGQEGDSSTGELSQEEQHDIEKMKSTDRRVHSHEQAHLAAAGNLARGGANFSYETGPDGKRYAVGGEVNIDTAPVDGDPQATLVKSQRIQRAAMAPADPSPQDRAIAAEAAAMGVRAAQEMARQRSEGAAGYGGSGYGSSKSAQASRINLQV